MPYKVTDDITGWTFNAANFEGIAHDVLYDDELPAAFSRLLDVLIKNGGLTIKEAGKVIDSDIDVEEIDEQTKGSR